MHLLRGEEERGEERKLGESRKKERKGIGEKKEKETKQEKEKGPEESRGKESEDEDVRRRGRLLSCVPVCLHHSQCFYPAELLQRITASASISPQTLITTQLSV